jgi:hypothetical protein
MKTMRPLRAPRKPLGFTGCNSRPRTGSLHSVAWTFSTATPDCDSQALPLDASSLQSKGNMHFPASIALLLLASSAFTQTVSQPSSYAASAIWEPPEWNFPQNVKATVRKEMVSTFRVSGYDITLEKTSMKDVEQHLGGVIGEKGDAGDASEWLCFHGADAMGGWVLWLENGEINGGSVGSFQWQRLSNRDVLDTRCNSLRKTGSVIQLPLSLQLEAKSSEVLKSFGPPTLKTDERLIYLHEHEVGGTRAGDPFISSNIVVVYLRNGIVWAIQISKTTSD